MIGCVNLDSCGCGIRSLSLTVLGGIQGVLVDANASEMEPMLTVKGVGL